MHSQYDLANRIIPSPRTKLTRSFPVFFSSSFQALIYIHCIATILSLLTTRWYAGFWLAVFCLLAILFVPTYSRLGGFVGNTSHM